MSGGGGGGRWQGAHSPFVIRASWEGPGCASPLLLDGTREQNPFCLNVSLLFKATMSSAPKGPCDMAKGHIEGERAYGGLRGSQTAPLTGMVVKPRSHPKDPSDINIGWGQGQLPFPVTETST